MAGGRSGATHKGVEEKRRNLPIYQHYTLSPGKTKSHHPEAKCNHCLKEFVCGSKQRLIRHLRKCPSVTNSNQVITETLNTLEATGKLNHSVLEASNLLPSQLSHYHVPHPHHNQSQPNQHHHHQQQQQIINQAAHQPIHHPSSSITTSSTSTTANSNVLNSNNNVNSHHNTSSSVMNDNGGSIASSSNGSQLPAISTSASPARRIQRRGRKSGANSLNSTVPSIHVTTGLDGKMHFTAAAQLPPNITGSVGAPLITQVHNGPRSVGYAYSSTVSTTASPGSQISANSGHLTCATTNHHSTPFKLNTELVDKAYLKLVITRNLPLSLCDTKEFQMWVKTFANDYKSPNSINLIRQNLKNEAQAARQRVSNILVKAPKKTINLELHNWYDERYGQLWYAMVANLDHKRFLLSIRDANQIASDVSAQLEGICPEKILESFIDECIKRVGSDRVNSLILSNGEDVLATRARESLDTNHPSIVTYDCWWHFTNLLCSDIIERDDIFQDLLRNSNRLIDFIDGRRRILTELPKFSPFVGYADTLSRKRKDKRWYSHLVCYLLHYIKENREALVKAIEASSAQSQLSSDSNNNSSGASNNTHVGLRNVNSSTQSHIVLTNIHEVKSIVVSPEYWNQLDSALFYLRPIYEISALKLPSTQSNNHQNSSIQEISVHRTSPTANCLFLTDYMHWFLNYGKSLFDSWKQDPNSIRYQVIRQFLKRFSLFWSKFKILFAAYLLNPKYRCAFITQEAKEMAIVEVLNIASEFMPEESDGHTIFDQWKLYLIREEPYDTVFDENRSTPMEWWLSLPCAESIRRVALRILRLKAFNSPRPETLFSQLHYYEDETKSFIDHSTYEDLAVLRYFYDYEDKIGLVGSVSHNHASLNAAVTSNGVQDRADVGELHNSLNQSDISSKCLFSSYESSEMNGQLRDSMNEGQSFSDTYSDDVYENNNESDVALSSIARNLSIETLPGYDLFTKYIDYNEQGVQVVEEPIEKKKRKWTAQEILSKFQANHQNNNTTRLE